MRKSTLLAVIIFLSIAFNVGYAITAQSQGQTVRWPFFEIGPSIIQGSYYIRAPGVESPFGIIGDIPGGYSLYTGSPLQGGTHGNLTDSSVPQSWTYGLPRINPNIILLGILFAAIPLSLILLLGRRSYGSTKTQ